mgnify:CR=1 FL=1
MQARDRHWKQVVVGGPGPTQVECLQRQPCRHLPQQRNPRYEKHQQLTMHPQHPQHAATQSLKRGRLRDALHMTYAGSTHRRWKQAGVRGPGPIRLSAHNFWHADNCYKHAMFVVSNRLHFKPAFRQGRGICPCLHQLSSKPSGSHSPQ